MQDAKIKLQDAFNRGFVPKDLREAMAARGHSGQVWIIENDDEDRVGVGYKMIDALGRESNQIHWYDFEEVKRLLEEIK